MHLPISGLANREGVLQFGASVVACVVAEGSSLALLLQARLSRFVCPGGVAP